MEQQNVILEITDTEIRLLIGYVKDNKPHIVYTTQRKIDGLIKNGEILDYRALTDVLSTLKEVKDSNKEKFIINQVTVILPAVGLSIFEDKKTCNVVDRENIIGNIDIQDVLSLVSKAPVPFNYDIIDIIPDQFILDGGKTMRELPLGEKSRELTLKAKIHTLPSKTVAEYKKVIEGAKFTIQRFCLNSYAATELGRYTKGIPSNYILVDMGSEVSGITLVGNHSPYGTITFNAGGKYIVDKLFDKYGFSKERGLELLTKYGYNTRKLSFSPAIDSVNLGNGVEDLTQEDINKLIKDYFDNEYFPALDNAFDALFADYDESIRHLPIVFTGGFSMMIGFEELAREKFQDHVSLHFLAPKTIGARSAQLAVSVGGLLVACSKKGAYSEQKFNHNFISR